MRIKALGIPKRDFGAAHRTLHKAEHIEMRNIFFLDVVLPAGSVFNLNPQQLTCAVSARLGRDITAQRVIRLGLLTDELKPFE